MRLFNPFSLFVEVEERAPVSMLAGHGWFTAGSHAGINWSTRKACELIIGFPRIARIQYILG